MSLPACGVAISLFNYHEPSATPLEVRFIFERQTKHIRGSLHSCPCSLFWRYVHVRSFFLNYKGYFQAFYKQHAVMSSFLFYPGTKFVFFVVICYSINIRKQKKKNRYILLITIFQALNARTAPHRCSRSPTTTRTWNRSIRCSISVR